MVVTFGSLFSGAGLMDLGFERAGLDCLWQCEIDTDARRVLAHHWPKIPCHEDVRGVGRHNLAPVDVIVGGFPCQDLSVAGQRAGISGTRSGLFYEMTRITHELQPRFLVWENVPGLLNSFTPVNPPPADAPEGSEWEMDEDSDFEAVLCELHRIGFCGGWTSLDARFFGVAQRRRRVFGVFARNDIGAECCAEILAFTTRRKGNLAPGEEAKTRVAKTLRGRSHGPGVSAPGRGGKDDENLVAATLNSGGNNGGFRSEPGEHLIAAPLRSNQHCDHLGDESKLVLARCETPGEGNRLDGDSCSFVTHSLTSAGADASEDGTGRGIPLAVIGFTQSSDPNNWMDNAMPPLTRRHGDPGNVAQIFETRIARNGRGQPSEVAHAKRGHEAGGTSDCRPMLLAPNQIVRRLTPTECLRLMGAPDTFLDLTPPLSDSAKYRLCGNGVVVSVAAWIARRIKKHLEP